eukprot:797775-Pelagomonas_calceolata.AAC.1
MTPNIHTHIHTQLSNHEQKHAHDEGPPPLLTEVPQTSIHKEQAPTHDIPWEEISHLSCDFSLQMLGWRRLGRRGLEVLIATPLEMETFIPQPENLGINRCLGSSDCPGTTWTTTAGRVSFKHENISISSSQATDACSASVGCD